MPGQILKYLTKHPQGSDTLEGIVEWWLLEQRIEWYMARVKAALAELRARGFISVRREADSRVHYRINREKLKEIKTFIRQRSEGASG